MVVFIFQVKILVLNTAAQDEYLVYEAEWHLCTLGPQNQGQLCPASGMDSDQLPGSSQTPAGHPWLWHEPPHCTARPILWPGKIHYFLVVLVWQNRYYYQTLLLLCDSTSSTIAM